jgi:hypothetical protein
VRIAGCPACQPLDVLRDRAEELAAADGRVDPTAPHVGQCFTTVITYVEPVDCAETHYREVMAVLRPPGAEGAPRTSAVDRWARDRCEGLVYRQYRGQDSDDDPDYVVEVDGPLTSAEWDLGQRWLACVLTPTAGTTEGSARHTD